MAVRVHTRLFHLQSSTYTRLTEAGHGNRLHQALMVTPFYYAQPGLLSVACSKCSNFHTLWPARQVCRLLRHMNLRIAAHLGGFRSFSTAVTKDSSSLFVSGGSEDPTPAPVQVSLGLETRLSAENVDELWHNIQARRMAFKLDQLLEDYETFKEIDKVKVELEEERAQISSQIAALVKEKSGPKEDVAKKKAHLSRRGKIVREEFKSVMKIWWEAEEKVMLQALKLPADLHSETPKDKDKVLDSTDGTLKSPGPPVSHVDFAENLGLLKFSNVGPWSAYLLGDLAEFEMLLTQFVMDKMRDHNLLQIACPEIFRSVIVEGCGYDPRNFQQIFTLQDKEEESLETGGYHLKGTSLLSYAAFLARVMVRAEQLPLQLFSLGRHYQPVASHGDLPGMYGVPQSNRVTMFGACRDADEATDVCRRFTQLAWDVTKELGLSARLVSVAPLSLKLSESWRTEIQVWAPSLQSFLQIGEVSNHGDFVSRRLMSRQYPSGDLVHMVSGVAMDITKVLATILEHSYSQDKLVFPTLPATTKM